MIDINPDHLETVRRILAEHVPECEVRAFGSRVDWTAKDYSDLDLAVAGEKALQGDTLRRLKEAFEVSDLPFRVDVLDWHAISPSFRKVIEKQCATIHKPNQRARARKSRKKRGRRSHPPSSTRSSGPICRTSAIAGEWPIRKLADLCDSVDYGYTASAKDMPCGPKFLRITDIVSGAINWKNVPYCEIEDAAHDRYRLHDADVVIARTGATTGYSLYIANPPDAVFASYLVRLKIGQEAHARFMAYFLKSHRFWSYLRGVLGDKSAQPNAIAKTMTQVELLLPPLKEQQAIACILGALDDKIELNRRISQTLEAMARAIFKSWFVDFDPVRARRGESPYSPCPGLAPHIADLFPDGFEDSELGEIPKGWRVGHLGDIIEIHDSKRIPLSSRERQKRQGPFPYYGAAGIVDHVDDFLFDGIHVLVGEDGSVVTDTGKPVVQYVWGKFWVNNHAHVLKGTGGISDEQLLLLLQQVYVVPFVTGAVQPKLSQTNMKAIPVVHGSPRVNQVFGDIIRPVFAKIRARQNEVETLSHLRDTLLPRLISGELRVPETERIVGRAT